MCSTALCLQLSGSNEGENMDAPLQDCTIEEQRDVVRFLWAKGVKPVEIPSYVGSVWTEHHESTKGLEWVERFKFRSNTCYWWRSFWSAINITQPKSFFSAGIQKLVEGYNKYIVLQGDYVEKWYVKLLTVTSIKAVRCILPFLFDSPSFKNIYIKTHVGCIFDKCSFNMTCFF